ncbi:S8 family peptidase [soil metagenome]
MAVAIAFVLVWLSPDARGATTNPKADEDRQGAPYAAGELLVTYEPGASGQHIDAVVEESEARVEEEISTPGVQLLSFPAVKHERSEHAREKKLQRAKEALQRDPSVEHVAYNYLRLPDYVPNDPEFGSQWDLYSIGAPDAWDKTLGVGSRVAVVDTGIDGDHPELESKIVSQKDMVNNDVVAEDDRRGHGTHVAGTVGAVTNNGAGVAAVCPACKLLVAKSGDSRGLYDSDIVQGIYWGVKNRAKAINLSLGSEGKSRILEHAVNYAWDHGVVVVAAAGNANTSKPNYPAAYKNVISVAATDQLNKKASFSNYGKIDVAAPGVKILSTFPGGGYEIMPGTSMASPHVAALAGLLAAQDRSAPEIRRRIQRTATDLGPDGKDKYYGWGLIDANKAVRR